MKSLVLRATAALLLLSLPSMPKKDPKRHPDGRFKSQEEAKYKDSSGANRSQGEIGDFLSLAMERFKLSEEAEAAWRRDALEDFEFYIGNQWPADIKSSRDRDKRPCLTINRLKPAKRIITNQYRQQRPAIQVNPVGDGATVETAQIEQGIVRHIEVGSDAEVAYDIAFDNMTIGGAGWLELSTQYRQGGKKREQEIKIRAAKNPFTHYADPTSEEPDYSDAQYHFKVHDFTKAEFKAKWPRSQAASLEDFSSVGDAAKDWLQKDQVRVVEYWYMEEPERKLQAEDDEDSDASANPTDEDAEATNEVEAEEDATEDTPEPVCRKAIITAIDILEDKETVWDSIPNVPIWGEDLDVNGKRYLAGMVRDAKDPQREFNYWETAITEAIALAPKSPFKAYAEVIENYETEWQEANRTNKAVLLGNAKVVDGNLLPLPERESPDVPIQALAAMRQSAAANLEAVTGINDAMLGRMRPDESGKAVLARQKQGDISNLNYADNAARSLRRVGRLLLCGIPKVYDTPRIMRIINPDGTHSHVITHLGPEQRDGKNGALALQQQNPAITKIFDLSVGSYDVALSVGSYETKRQEAVASIMALIQAAPNVLSIVGDLLVGNMDWNNAPEIAKRLKKMLPPQLQEEDGQTSPEQQAQQAQAQLAALTEVHQQVMGALEQAQAIIHTKTIEQQGKANIEKMRIDAEVLMAKMKALTPILVAEINTKAQDRQVRAQIDADVAMELHSAAHDVAMASVVPAAQQAQTDAAAASQNADQIHQQEMAANAAEQNQPAQES